MEMIVKVNGMTCGHCTSSVEEAVGNLAGVEAVEANLETKEVRVSGENLSEETIKETIEEIGFDVE